ncbi:MAG: 50S ribosomal protein L13 [Candidatus Marsarchaeota archaeon]|nr:50S ribosomal protein L13 [Candidatus Marsarchaeota archaeon]
MAERVIDGEGRILGRVSSYAAKLLLNGDSVRIVNAEKIIISGHLRDIVAKYKQKAELKDKANPEHSPYVSRRPDLFVKRVVRGMLPYRRPKGKEAYKRLRVYVGVPEGTPPFDTLELKKGEDVYEDIITVKALSEKLGYRGA